MASSILAASRFALYWLIMTDKGTSLAMAVAVDVISDRMYKQSLLCLVWCSVCLSILKLSSSFLDRGRMASRDLASRGKRRLSLAAFDAAVSASQITMTGLPLRGGPR